MHYSHTAYPGNSQIGLELAQKTGLHCLQSYIVQILDVFVCEACICLAPSSSIDWSLISFGRCITVGRVVLFTFNAAGCSCCGGYNCGGCFQHGCIIFMHALHMPADVHLLFGSVHTKWTLKLWIFATLPFLMIAQWWFQFIDTAAIGSRTCVATAWLLTATIRWGICIAAVRRATIMCWLHEWNEKKCFGFKFIMMCTVIWKNDHFNFFAEFSWIKLYFILFFMLLDIENYQVGMKCAV